MEAAHGAQSGQRMVVGDPPGQSPRVMRPASDEGEAGFDPRLATELAGIFTRTDAPVPTPAGSIQDRLGE